MNEIPKIQMAPIPLCFPVDQAGGYKNYFSVESDDH